MFFFSQFRPRQKQIIIDFELIESTAGTIPTLTSIPLTNNSSNGDNLEPVLRKRLDVPSEKKAEKCCLKEKDAILTNKRKDDLGRDKSFVGNLPDLNRNESRKADRISNREEYQRDIEFRFAISSVLFVGTLILLIWQITLSLEDDMSLPPIKPARSSISWTQGNVAENPLF